MVRSLLPSHPFDSRTGTAVNRSQIGQFSSVSEGTNRTTTLCTAQRPYLLATLILMCFWLDQAEKLAALLLGLYALALLVLELGL